MNSFGLTVLSTDLSDTIPLNMPFPKEVVPFLLIIFVALAILMVLAVWSRRGVASKRMMTLNQSTSGEDTLSIAVQPFLSKQEAILYNMIHLAVQDSFLVFAKIPLSRVVSIAGENRDHRKVTLRAIRSIHVDVVLVHPGTLLPVHAITFRDKLNGGNSDFDPEILRCEILRSANIEEVQLHVNKTYTVPQLVELLGLKEED